MLVAGAVQVEAQTTEAPARKIESFSILSEPLPFKSGTPFSSRVLVTRPAPIKGLITWTIETQRHRGGTYTAALNPDGSLAATGGLDGTIRIWDTQSGKFARALVAHDSYVYSLAWSPDGKYLASAGAYDTTARIWNTETGKLLRTKKHSSYAYRLAWSHDGRQLVVSGGESGHALVLDTVNGTEMAKMEVGQRISSLAWSPDGRTIAMGVMGQGASLVDASTFKAGNAIGEGNYEAVGLTWSPDSQYVAVASPKGTLVWNAVENKLAQTLPTASAAAWSPDGKILAITPRGGPIELWDPLGNTSLQKLPHGATGMEWSASGTLLMSYHGDHVTIWDVAAKKVRQTIHVAGGLPYIEWLNGKFVASGMGTSTITLSTVVGEHVRDLKGTAAASAVALSANGKVLAVGGVDKNIQVYEIASGKVLNTLKGHTAPVTAIAWSSNGKTLASGSTDKSVRIWDAPTGKLEHTMEGHSGSVQALSWSAKTVASAGADSQTILWNSSSGQKIRALASKDPVESLAWTDDGKFLATGDRESGITLWNVATGASMTRLERAGSPPAVSALAWSPKLPLLAAGRANHRINLWDSRNGKVTQDIPALAPVKTLSWSGGGGVVVCGTIDRCLRSWDATSGRLLATMIVDGNRIAVVQANGHYRAATDSDSELVYIAQTAAGQETYSPKEFATKFNWKNASQVRFVAP